MRLPALTDDTLAPAYCVVFGSVTLLNAPAKAAANPPPPSPVKSAEAVTVRSSLTLPPPASRRPDTSV